MWFECHCTGKTKPCLHAITDGQIECPMCESLKPTEQIGYMPLYRELDGKPVMVLVHENVRETVDSHRFLARVAIGRGGDSTDGVYVQRCTSKGAPYSSTLPDRQKPADIWPTLVRMWKLPALTEWDARHNGVQAGGVLHSPAKPATGPVVPTAPATGRPTSEPAPLADLFGSILERVKARGESADDRTPLDPPKRPVPNE